MLNPRSLTLLSALLLSLAFATSRAEAQVLVYKIEILKENGINYEPFQGGFFAAPLLGGSGTFLLTSTDGPRTFTEAPNSGRLFTAVDGKEKKAVISATTGGDSTAQGALVCIGKIDHQLNVRTPTVSLSIRVADSLTGTAVSADDESTVSEPAADGSIGSAGVSQLRMVLDEPQTNHANRQGLSLTQTVAELALELSRQGYSKETETTDPDTTSATATTPTP